MKQIAIVTGTSNGFGKLIAKTLASKNIIVFAGMRNPKGSNLHAAQELSSIPNIEVFELNITNEEKVKTAIDTIAQKVGQIDILVNNAGVYGLGLVEQFSTAEIKKQMDVNFYGTLNVTRATLPYMRNKKAGLIINISSGLGRITMPFNAVYGATKYALEAVSQGLRHELRMVGVDLVVIEPGIFPTTNASTTAQQYNASNIELAKEYGELAVNFPAIMGNNFQQMIDNGFAANPQIVADTVLSVVEIDSAKRPFRVLADPMTDGKMQKLNDLNEEMQQDLLNGMQLSFLA